MFSIISKNFDFSQIFEKKYDFDDNFRKIPIFSKISILVNFSKNKSILIFEKFDFF